VELSSGVNKCNGFLKKAKAKAKKTRSYRHALHAAELEISSHMPVAIFEHQQ
jgi:hypothetical protein